MFDYLSTRRAKFKLIIILLTMFTFNAISLTFAIKQNNVLFVFLDNVKNAQEKKNIFYDAIELRIQNVIAISNNMKLINVNDFENTSAMLNFKVFSTLFFVRLTISNSIFNSSFALNRLYAYRYI